MKTPTRLIENLDNNYQMLYFTSTSITSDGMHLFGMTDEGGHWNIFVLDLETREYKLLTDNRTGYMKSYVYFDGLYHEGLGKASVSLDRKKAIVYYLFGDEIRKTDASGNTVTLNRIPPRMMSAFTHVSEDGRYLCVPVTEERCLEYNLDKEGSGFDRRPTFSIDQRCIEENLSSFILVYDAETGELVRNEEIPQCWITHVQFSPTDNRRILYNNEWTYKDCGVRRVWLLDENDNYRPVRQIIGKRRKSDWVCHEIWTPDGKSVIYHGGYDGGDFFLGKQNLETGMSQEIAFDPLFTSYGHFTLVSGDNKLLSDGYFFFKDKEIKKAREDRDYDASSNVDFSDKDSKYISVLDVDWNGGTISWHPLCEHGGEWYDQDSHPHPVSNDEGEYGFFTSRRNGKTNIYRIPIEY